MAEKLRSLLIKADKLDKEIKKFLSETKDYDLLRILKKVDAELMDMRHNLELASKLADKKRKDK